ncbi:hypothetical protein [Cyanobium sp. CH-040]|uniref:hypothetical protein n=1 Tax=Cyanobium sp. CH-040 TaxID=2823708 RepID=UPI0020CC6B1F|nr:hypothetical protein [Cyanobium sp. CH-040]MCP9926351.1 hypothetical protein [Cyanobium sp. CH-040]
MLLPLAMNVALLLMLSSLLLLTLALQSRLQAAVQRQRRLAEDQLMNVAQLWAGRVQRGCPQALALAAGDWHRQPWSGQAGCAALEAGEGYRLVSYVPGPVAGEAGGPDQGTGDLVLELTGTGTGTGTDTAPRGAFALHWRRELPGDDTPAGPPQLVGIEERGLRASAGEAGGEVTP